MCIKRKFLYLSLTILLSETLIFLVNAKSLTHTVRRPNKQINIKLKSSSLKTNSSSQLPNEHDSYALRNFKSSITEQPYINDVEYNLRLRQLMEELVLGTHLVNQQHDEPLVVKQQQRPLSQTTHTYSEIKVNLQSHNNNNYQKPINSSFNIPPIQNQQTQHNASLIDTLLEYVMREFMSKNKPNLNKFSIGNLISPIDAQTMQKQLEFLQKNAEIIKKFQQVQERGKNSSTQAALDSLQETEQIQEENSLNTALNFLMSLSKFNLTTASAENITVAENGVNISQLLQSKQNNSTPTFNLAEFLNIIDKMNSSLDEKDNFKDINFKMSTKIDGEPKSALNISDNNMGLRDIENNSHNLNLKDTKTISVISANNSDVNMDLLDKSDYLTMPNKTKNYSEKSIITTEPYFELKTQNEYRTHVNMNEEEALEVTSYFLLKNESNSYDFPMTNTTNDLKPKGNLDKNADKHNEMERTQTYSGSTEYFINPQITSNTTEDLLEASNITIKDEQSLLGKTNGTALDNDSMVKENILANLSNTNQSTEMEKLSDTNDSEKENRVSTIFPIEDTLKKEMNFTLKSKIHLENEKNIYETFTSGKYEQLNSNSNDSAELDNVTENAFGFLYEKNQEIRNTDDKLQNLEYNITNDHRATTVIETDVTTQFPESLLITTTELLDFTYESLNSDEKNIKNNDTYTTEINLEEFQKENSTQNYALININKKFELENYNRNIPSGIKFTVLNGFFNNEEYPDYEDLNSTESSDMKESTETTDFDDESTKSERKTYSDQAAKYYSYTTTLNPNNERTEDETMELIKTERLNFHSTTNSSPSKDSDVDTQLITTNIKSNHNISNQNEVFHISNAINTSLDVQKLQQKTKSSVVDSESRFPPLGKNEKEMPETNNNSNVITVAASPIFTTKIPITNLIQYTTIINGNPIGNSTENLISKYDIMEISAEVENISSAQELKTREDERVAESSTYREGSNTEFSSYVPAEDFLGKENITKWNENTNHFNTMDLQALLLPLINILNNNKSFPESSNKNQNLYLEHMAETELEEHDDNVYPVPLIKPDYKLEDKEVTATRTEQNPTSTEIDSSSKNETNPIFPDYENLSLKAKIHANDRHTNDTSSDNNKQPSTTSANNNILLQLHKAKPETFETNIRTEGGDFSPIPNQDNAYNSLEYSNDYDTIALNLNVSTDNQIIPKEQSTEITDTLIPDYITNIMIPVDDSSSQTKFNNMTKIPDHEVLKAGKTEISDSIKNENESTAIEIDLNFKTAENDSFENFNKIKSEFLESTNPTTANTNFVTLEDITTTNDNISSINIFDFLNNRTQITFKSDDQNSQELSAKSKLKPEYKIDVNLPIVSFLKSKIPPEIIPSSQETNHETTNSTQHFTGDTDTEYYKVSSSPNIDEHTIRITTDMFNTIENKTPTAETNNNVNIPLNNGKESKIQTETNSSQITFADIVQPLTDIEGLRTRNNEFPNWENFIEDLTVNVSEIGNKPFDYPGDKTSHNATIASFTINVQNNETENFEIKNYNIPEERIVEESSAQEAQQPDAISNNVSEETLNTALMSIHDGEKSASQIMFTNSTINSLEDLTENGSSFETEDYEALNTNTENTTIDLYYRVANDREKVKSSSFKNNSSKTDFENNIMELLEESLNNFQYKIPLNEKNVQGTSTHKENTKYPSEKSGSGTDLGGSNILNNINGVKAESSELTNIKSDSEVLMKTSNEIPINEYTDLSMQSKLNSNLEMEHSNLPPHQVEKKGIETITENIASQTESNEDVNIKAVTEIVWLSHANSIRKPTSIIKKMPGEVSVIGALYNVSKDTTEPIKVEVAKPKDKFYDLNELIVIIGNSLQKFASANEHNDELHKNENYNLNNNEKNNNHNLPEVLEEVISTVNYHTTTISSPIPSDIAMANERETTATDDKSPVIIETIENDRQNNEKWSTFKNNQLNNDSLTKSSNLAMKRNANVDNEYDDDNDDGNDDYYVNATDEDNDNSVVNKGITTTSNKKVIRLDVKVENENNVDEYKNSDNDKIVKNRNNHTESITKQEQHWNNNNIFKTTQNGGSINEMSTNENKLLDISEIAETTTSTTILYEKFEMVNENFKNENTNKGNKMINNNNNNENLVPAIKTSNENDKKSKGIDGYMDNTNKNISNKYVHNSQSFPDMTTPHHHHSKLNLNPNPNEQNIDTNPNSISNANKNIIASAQRKEEITTENWWHSLPYEEIRKFLNSIFVSVTTSNDYFNLKQSPDSFVTAPKTTTMSETGIDTGSSTQTITNNNKIKTIKERKSKNDQWPIWILNNIWSPVL